RIALHSAEHGHAERTAPVGISRVRTRGRAKDAAHASNSHGMQAAFVRWRALLFATHCTKGSTFTQIVPVKRWLSNSQTHSPVRKTGSCANGPCCIRFVSRGAATSRSEGRRSLEREIRPAIKVVDLTQAIFLAASVDLRMHPVIGIEPLHDETHR